jgi:flagellar biogenesis protein FliO
MEIVRDTASAGLVLGLLAATLWLLRRKGLALPRRGRSERRLESLERLALGPHFTLHLVRLDGTALLLAATSSGCSVVERRPLDGGTDGGVR